MEAGNVHSFEIERGSAPCVLDIRAGDFDRNVFRGADLRAGFRAKEQDLRCDPR